MKRLWSPWTITGETGPGAAPIPGGCMPERGEAQETSRTARCGTKADVGTGLHKSSSTGPLAVELKFAVCVGLILFIAIGSVSVGQQPTPSADAPPAKEAPGAAKNEKTTAKQEWLEHPAGEVDIPWMRIMYGIGTVLVLICIGVYVLKRFAGSSLGSGQFLDVQEVVPVGRNLRLIVIEMGDKVLLVASTEENVTKIGEYSREDVPIPAESEGEPSSDFSTLLGDMLKGNR